jgi:tetratricopeptide (TPR) repeat protein
MTRSILLIMAMFLTTSSIAFCDSANDFFKSGQAKWARDDFRGALDDYSRAIKLNPEFAEAYNSRGSAKVALGDLHGAIEDFNTAIKLNPNFAEAYNGRGSARLRSDIAGSIADDTKALELKPDFVDAYFNRAFAKQTKGDMAGAIADYSKALELKPDLAIASEFRAKAMESLDGNGQRVPILFRSGTKQAEAALVLAASWTFEGREGGFVTPSSSYLALTGDSGITNTTFGPVALKFSSIYKKDEPYRVYFGVGGGDLQIWWSGDAKSAIPDKDYLVQLSPAWLAASKELEATSDHPAGGISISSHRPNGQPLVFFVEFARIKTLMPAPNLESVGTE